MQATEAEAGVVSNGFSKDSSQANSPVFEPLDNKPSKPGTSGRPSDLSFQIPPRPVGFGSRCGKGLLQSQGSSKGSSSPGGFLRGLSFQKKGNAADGDRSSLLTPDSKPSPESPSMSGFPSPFFWIRCTSLPVTPASNLSPSVTMPGAERMAAEQYKSNKVMMRRFRKRKLCAESALMNVMSRIHSKWNAAAKVPYNLCTKHVPLNGLVREETKTEVFGQEVRNLPVTLLRVPTTARRGNRQNINPQRLPSETVSAWQDFVVLMLISTICYFFFLEQLLIQEMKREAIMIAAPFAFTLGLLASTFAVLLASKEYTWTYAALEFALVALTVHLLYGVVHMKAVFAILISGTVSFVTTMALNSLYIYCFGWRVQVAGNSSPV